MTRPPSDRGQGRKPIDKDGELMRSRPVRMTDAQWEKCKRLGGAAFLRKKIDQAKEPHSAPQPYAENLLTDFCERGEKHGKIHLSP